MMYRQRNPSYAIGAEILQDAHYLDLGDCVESLVVILLLVALSFVGYKAAVAQKTINELNNRIKLVTEQELNLAEQLQKKTKQISNLQKTNALLQAKIDSQEQKIKKISQFFGK